MGSDEDDEKDSKENENAADDLETQRFDSESSLELTDENGLEFQCTEPFNDTSTNAVECETQVWVDDDETQEVGEDWNNYDENEIMTQLVVDDTEVQNYSEGDDGERSDRTDVLTEAGESDCESEIGAGLGDDDGLQGQEDAAIYSNDSIIERLNSGRKVSTAIQLSNNTKEADRVFELSVDGTNASRASILSSSNEDGEMAGLDDPGEEGIDVDGDCEGENMKLLKDEMRNNDAVRRLFTDETAYRNSGATNRSDSTYGGRDSPDLNDGHKLTDLSYLNSQEPGELSQAIALDAVDKFLLVNNVDCSQEDTVYLEKMVKEKSPVVPSAKGSRVLAYKSNDKSPVGLGILDWDASREDEGGGDFFSKNKDVLFTSSGRGRGRGRKSFTQPRIPRSLKSGQGNNVDDKEQGLNLRQKIMGTVHSDSRLLRKSRTDDKKVKARKNLFQEFDEQINLGSAEREESNIVKDSRGMYDVGIDTQMAAEAMEALVCGFQNNHDTADVIQDLPNAGDVMSNKSYTDHASAGKRLSSSDIEGLFKESKRTKTHDTRLRTSSRMSSKTLAEDLRENLAVIPKRKRGRPKSVEKPSTDILISSLLHPKRTKLEAFTGAVIPKRKRGRPKSVEKPSTDILISSLLHPKRNKMEAFTGSSAIKPKQKSGVSPSNGNAAALCDNSSRRLSKVSAQRKVAGVVDKSISDEVDKNTNSSFSGMSSSTAQQLLNKSPVARRTRQCRTVNALKEPENLPGGSGEKEPDDIAVPNVFETEKVCSKMGTYTSEPSVFKGRCSGSGGDLVDDVAKDKPTLHEPLGLDFSHERSVKTHTEINPSSKNGGMKKNLTMSGHLKESGDLVSPSTVVGGVLEANGPITRSSRLRNHTKSTALELGTKRITQSSISVHPPSSSVKNSKGNMIEQVVEPLCAFMAVDGPLFVNDKAILQDDGKDTASKKFGKNGDASPSKDVVGETAGLSTPKVIPHGVFCVTPNKSIAPANVSTPLNEDSPICFGNGYQKPSCKKSLSKPSLARELNNLYTEAVLTPPSKDLRKRRDMGSVCVLFSRHLSDDIIKQQKKILARLGASVASSSLEATHFVANKFVRTRNMLEAIALAKPVVTHLWLKSCGQVSCFTDERNYILRDLKKEKEIGFSMPTSLTRASQSPLLKGRRVFITANVKPNQELVANLVKAVHGQAVERLGRSAMKDDKVLDDLLVFSCEEDYEICVPLLEKGVAIYSSELLLNGIVMQKLEYERHRLFSDNVKRTRSSVWIRKDGEKFLPVTKRK